MIEQRPIYTKFADIYDETMRHVPYYSWAEYLLKQFKGWGLQHDAAIADLGCGTGQLLRYIQPQYSNAIGIDFSVEMLERAEEKSLRNLIEADITELPFKDGSIKVALATHDTINYLPEQEMVLQHFRAVKRALKKNAYYIFDISTENNVQEHYHQKIFSEKFGDLSLEWQNSYNPQKKIITSTLYFNESNSKMMVEEHLQRIFSESEIENILKETGFKILKRIADYKVHKKLKKANLMAYIVVPV